MDNSKIRIAMIGAGGMANSVHYPSLASFNDVKIVAICDLNQERLNTTGNTYNIEKRYENYVKMIEDTAPEVKVTSAVAPLPLPPENVASV